MGPTHPTIVNQAFREDIPLDDNLVAGFVDGRTGDFFERFQAETGGLLREAGLSPGQIRRSERIPGFEKTPFGELEPAKVPTPSVETFGATGNGVKAVHPCLETTR